MGKLSWERTSAGWLGGVLAMSLALVAACDDETKHPSAVGMAGAGHDGAAGNTGQAGSKTSGGSSANSAGSGAAGFSASGGQANDPEGFLEASGKAYCARLFRCFEGKDDFMGARIVLKTREGCEALLPRVNAQQGSRRDLQAQLAAGRLHYNAEAAKKCLAELAACNGTDSYTEGSCREVYEGSIQTGGACQRNEDCQGDAFCQVAGATCPGQCEPRKAEGEPCQSSEECAYSTGAVFCDPDAAAGPVCRTLPPGPKAGLGEPCTRLLPGSETLISCDDDLWCGLDPALGNAAAQGRCVAPLSIDDPCSDSDDVCVGGVCNTTTGFCAQAVLRSSEGETCDKAMLVACDPTLGLRCSASEQGTCEGSGDGSEGSPCFGGDFQRGCDAGLYCAPSDALPTGTCRPWLVAGSACDQGSACESGSCETTCQERYCAR